MSSESHVADLLPAYALQCLDEEEAIAVSEHLATCTACRDQLAAYTTISDQLALAAPSAEPSARLKQRLMERITRTPESKPRPSWWQRMIGGAPSRGLAWGVAAVALVVSLVIGGLWLWQQTMPQPGMQTIAMAGTAAAPGASGLIVVTEDGMRGSLVVDDLPPLDTTRQYQLWLIKDGQRTSGGVFSVDAAGYGLLWIAAPQPLSSYDTFGITIEPTGGSPGPTGQKVLGT